MNPKGAPYDRRETERREPGTGRRDDRSIEGKPRAGRERAAQNGCYRGQPDRPQDLNELRDIGSARNHRADGFRASHALRQAAREPRLKAMPSKKQIEACQTPAGGYTRKTLARWGT